MKFLAYYSFFSLYFLCFVSTAPEPAPLLNFLISPSNSIVSRLSPLTDIISCLVVEVFSTFISVLCVTYNIVINLSQLLKCITANIPLLGDILSSVFNAIELGARKTNAACDGALGMYRKYMNETCIGVLPTLSGVTFALQDLGLMTPTVVDCSCDDSNSFPLIACLLLEVTYLYASLGCALNLAALAEFLTNLIKTLPTPLGTVLGILTDGLYYGLWNGTSSCKTILKVWRSGLKELCPAFLINTNDFLTSLYSLFA